jgi:uncharacterized oxidoreductase
VINPSSALAFVSLPSAPIYSASKAAIHSYTQSLRFQLEETGVEVIELMPPVVKTDLAADIAEGDGFTVIMTDELVKQSFVALKTGAVEIRPGQAKQLAFMRRFAPNFINRQLWKASKKLVPIGVAQAGYRADGFGPSASASEFISAVLKMVYVRSITRFCAPLKIVPMTSSPYC